MLSCCSCADFVSLIVTLILESDWRNYILKFAGAVDCFIDFYSIMTLFRTS